MGFPVLAVGAAPTLHKALPRSRTTITTLYIAARHRSTIATVWEDSHGRCQRLSDHDLQSHLGDIDQEIWRTIYENRQGGVGAHCACSLERLSEECDPAGSREGRHGQGEKSEVDLGAGSGGSVHFEGNPAE